MLRDLCVFQKAECKSIRQLLCHHEYLRFAWGHSLLPKCLSACMPVSMPLSLSLSLSVCLPSVSASGRARTGAMEVDVLVQAWIAVHMAGGISCRVCPYPVAQRAPIDTCMRTKPKRRGQGGSQSAKCVARDHCAYAACAREAQAPMLSSSLLSSRDSRGARSGKRHPAFRYLGPRRRRRNICGLRCGGFGGIVPVGELDEQRHCENHDLASGQKLVKNPCPLWPS